LKSAARGLSRQKSRHALHVIRKTKLNISARLIAVKTYQRCDPNALGAQLGRAAKVRQVDNEQSLFNPAAALLD
jgi:hypothetical protein